MQVPDLQKALNAAEDLGGKTIVPPTSTVTPPPSLPHAASAETRGAHSLRPPVSW